MKITVLLPALQDCDQGALQRPFAPERSWISKQKMKIKVRAAASSSAKMKRSEGEEEKGRLVLLAEGSSH